MYAYVRNSVTELTNCCSKSLKVTSNISLLLTAHLATNSEVQTAHEVMKSSMIESTSMSATYPAPTIS